MLEKFRPIVKEKLKDPDMCNCVKSSVDDVVDSTWPYIMDEVRYNLKCGIHVPYVDIPR